MTNWSVPLASVHVSDEDIDAVTQVYRSGWLTMGPETERFEQALASEHLMSEERHALHRDGRKIFFDFAEDVLL